MTALLALTIVLAQAAPVQQPATGTGLIVGQVVDASSNTPLPGVVVTLSGLPSPPPVARSGAEMSRELPGTRRVLTGRDGRFAFFDLPAGSYPVAAMKAGYSDGSYGRRRPGAAAGRVVLQSGERLGDVIIRMWRRAAISGRVVDEAGEPAVGITVRAFSRRGSSDRRFTQAGVTRTDDRGIYRLPPLDAGEYIVGIVPRTVNAPASFTSERLAGARLPGWSEIGGVSAPGNATGIQIGDQAFSLSLGNPVPRLTPDGRLWPYPAAFFPSGSDPAHATAITVAPGEERDGIDLQLTSAPAVTVSGAVSGLGDVAGLPVRLIGPLAMQLALDQELPATVTDRSGNFTFVGVVPGEYRLLATTPRFANTQPEPHFAEMQLTVGSSDVQGVVVAMRPALQVSGRFEYEGGRERPPGSSIQVVVERAGGPYLPLSRGDGTRAIDQGFVSGPHPPGRYYVRIVNSPRGWMFKSATLNGRDVADTAFELRDGNVSDVVITFSDRWSGLSGTVTGAGEAPDATATVVVFPTDPGTWSSAGQNSRRVRSVRTSPSGQFTFATLSPGEYLLAALREEDAAAWRDPEFLASIAPRAERITIRDGERPTQALRTLVLK